MTTMAAKPFDAASLLVGDRAAQQAFLDEALATGDPEDIKRALGTLARARNVSALAAEVGVTREGLRKALSPAGNPTLSTLVALGNALDLKIFRARTAPAGRGTQKREPRTGRARG